MNFSAKELANILGAEIVGDSDISVNSFHKIEGATAGSLTFLANPKYESFIYSTEASIVLVNNDFQPKEPISSTLLKVKDSYVALAQLMQLYAKNLPQPSGIHSDAVISDSAEIKDIEYIGAFTFISDNVKVGAGTSIYPQVFIGANVHIGKNCILYPGVKVYKDTRIGDNVCIHSNSVIGSDGFGFAPSEAGYEKIPQLGKVIIEDNVEIGANVCIDKPSMGATIIHKGVKLDNLIQIAHGVELGEKTVIAAQTGVSGSTTIGENCMIGGQVGFVGHIDIADGSKFGAQAGVNKTIKEENQAWNGTPAQSYSNENKSRSIYRHLPDMKKRIDQLEREIKELKKNIDS